MIITCPSGLQVEIRGMKLGEAQRFSDPSLIRTGGSMDMLLQACTLRTASSGPYPDSHFAKDGRPNWTKMLLGDRFTTIIDVRIRTWGSTYEFDVQCEKCRERYGWELELSDLERRELPAESAAKIGAGENSFETRLPDGKLLTFKLSTGEEEQKLQKWKRNNRGQLGPVDAIAVQTLSIEGIQSGADKWIREYLTDLDMPAAMDLLDDIQRADCGVETEIETVCEWCQWTQRIQLPFEATFFFPRKKKAKREEKEAKTPTASPDAKPSATPSSEG